MGRIFTTSGLSVWCVSALPALFCGLVLMAGQARAQPPPESAASRIEQMRDQAAAVSEMADGQLVVHQSEPEPSVNERLLPANESLPLGAGENGLFAGEADSTGVGSMGDGWLLSTLAALGVVLAIVFGIRWALRRGGVVGASVSQNSVVEVLSRTTVAPRSHIVLMRVGQRILVVSDSSAGMRTLDSVNDAEEVAELLGAIDAGKPASMSQSFGGVMKKLSGQWAGEESFQQASEEADAPTTVEGAQGSLSRVRGRLAALSDTGGRV